MGWFDDFLDRIFGGPAGPETDGGEWNETGTMTLDEPIEFEFESNTEADTEYELRAVADNGAETARGDIESFYAAETYTVAIIAEPGVELVDYEFETSGHVEFADLGETEYGRKLDSNGNNETIETHEGGSVTVSGLTGNGYGDAYRLTEPITAIDVEKPDGTYIEVDGERVALGDVPDYTEEHFGGSEDDDEDDGKEELEQRIEELEKRVMELEAENEALYDVVAEVEDWVIETESHAQEATTSAQKAREILDHVER